jgi:hypothetical protein
MYPERSWDASWSRFGIDSERGGNSKHPNGCLLSAAAFFPTIVDGIRAAFPRPARR